MSLCCVSVCPTWCRWELFSAEELMPALHDGHSRFYSSLRVMKESVTAGGLLLSQADVGKALSCPPAGHGGLAGTA